jgi:hypothetical protein
MANKANKAGRSLFMRIPSGVVDCLSMNSPFLSLSSVIKLARAVLRHPYTSIDPTF